MTKDRQAWLEERRSGIGGSDAAAVLGISPWATPVTVWLDKTGRSAPLEETEAMRIGTELEDFVARRYTMEKARVVHRYNKMIHKGCLIGNIDRLVVMPDQKIASHQGEIRTDTLLECKTASVEWQEGEVPLYYQTQVQHYMGLDDHLLHADVACLFLGKHKHFQVYRVERDDEVITYMQTRLTEWWQKHVVGDEMPLPTNEDDCKRLWARSNPGKTVQTTDEIKAILETLNAVRAAEKAAKDEAAKLQSDICAYLGDAEAIVGVDGKPLATWKSAKDSEKTNWEALARWLYSQNYVGSLSDDLIARFTETKPGARRFLLKI